MAVSNLANVSKRVRYVDVWGARQLQLAMFVDEANGGFLPNATQLRREYMDKHFTSSFEILRNQNFTVGLMMNTHSHNVSQSIPNQWDAKPPSVFLAAL